MHPDLIDIVEEHFGRNAKLPKALEEFIAATNSLCFQLDKPEPTSQSTPESSEGEPKLAQRALRQSQRHTQAILSALPDVVLSLSPEGVFLDASNTQAMQGLGFSPDDAIGNHLSDIFPEAIADTFLSNTTRALHTNTIQTADFMLDAADTPSGQRHYEARFVPFGHTEVVVVVRDITEIKQVQRQLALNDRMISMGVLAAGIAHEINNPLTYMITNCDYAITELQNCNDEFLSEILDALAETRIGADRVRNIVADLKMFSRDDESEPDPVDVHKILDSAINMAGAEFRHRARLVKSYGEIRPVYGSEARLAQVFVNLLVNAGQAIPEGQFNNSQILVKTQCLEGDVVVRIEDTGCGISQEKLSRIFEPFYTTKPVGIGTGLGLSICHNILKSLGGTISASSSNTGTVFEVRLPQTKGIDSLPSQMRHAKPQCRSTQILVVDDDQYVLKAVKRMLSGRQVSCASSGKEALLCLSGDDPGFEIVLCDLMMPVQSGLELFCEVKTRWPDLSSRFIFMTGGTSIRNARTLLGGTNCPLIEKPFDPATLQAMIDQRIGANADQIIEKRLK